MELILIRRIFRNVGYRCITVWNIASEYLLLHLQYARLYWITKHYGLV